jgi:hypothetical protein
MNYIHLYRDEVTAMYYQYYTWVRPGEYLGRAEWRNSRFRQSNSFFESTHAYTSGEDHSSLLPR